MEGTKVYLKLQPQADGYDSPQRQGLEMAPWWRIHTALAEGLSFGPSTHIRRLTTGHNSDSSGSDASFALCGHLY